MNTAWTLASTFLPPDDAAARAGPISDLTGLWAPAGGGPVMLVLAPRTPRDRETGASLSGFIPYGNLEGVLHFPPALFSSDGSVDGLHIAADCHLTRTPARITAGNSAISSRFLRLHLGPRVYEYARAGDVNADALWRFGITGHRGLAFAGLDNRPDALAHAWHFGASAVEMDVTVPYELSHGRKKPLLHEMRIYHPPFHWRESVRRGRVPRGYLRAEEGFAGLWRCGVPSFYVDPKTKWLRDPGWRGAVLERIHDLAAQALAATPGLRICLAAPNREAALGWGQRNGVGPELGWALEWTEVRHPDAVLDRVHYPPGLFSFNILNIRGSVKWPWIQWFCRTVSGETERMIGRMPQSLMFWTVNDRDHFKCSIKVATDPRRMGRHPESGEVSLMTDHPHRLAAWLAEMREADLRCVA